MKKDQTIREYISNWDPMHFIAEGAPKDEYNAEADEIAKLFNKEMTEEELGALIHKVFVDFMEIDPENFKTECMSRTSEVRKLLLKK